MLQYNTSTQRLSRDEELKLVQAAQRGDLDARDAVIRNAIPYAFAALRNYVRRGGDDALQEICAELCHALYRYNVTNSTARFCRYATVCARNHLNNLLSRKALPTAELDEDTFGEKQDGSCFEHRTYKRLYTELKKLPANHASIIARRYFSELDETTVSIAASLGVTKQRVHQLEQNALSKLRAQLADVAE